MELSKEILDKINLLQNKFEASGQDLSDYLDGLLYADYINYWDYIHLDTLLSLQTPRTPFPDEKIFIMYHQITELYFKLSLHEIFQIADHKNLDAEFFLRRVMRVNRYFEALIKSFEIMYKGMEREQFLKYRMSLIPASGFQSAQYRMIELCSTDCINLVQKDHRKSFKENASVLDMFPFLYWKQGAVESETGNKTLTLKQFEKKYTTTLVALGESFRNKNLWQRYLSLPKKDQKDSKIINALRQLDTNVNVDWPLMHLKSAITYLKQRSSDAKATGGTNWQEYLPPQFQKRIFYPKLWTKEEIDSWGKSFVENVEE